MEFLRVLLLVVESLCALLLIGLILLQKAKGEGLGMAFGGGTGEALFGARAGNVLTKMTVTLGITFLVTTLLLAMTYAGKQDMSLVEQSEIPAAVQSVESAPAVEAIPAIPTDSATVPAAE